MFQSDKKSTALGSILDPNIEINGNIDVTANLVIHGKVNGNVTSTQTLNTAKGSKINLRSFTIFSIRSEGIKLFKVTNP